MIAEATLSSGIGVALNNSPKSVAFVSHPAKAFLDTREGLTGIWDRKAMSLDGVEYAYNQWHILEENTPLFIYIKSLIISDYQNPLEGFYFHMNQQAGE